MKILVTPYTNPDLDGTACAYAYAEYLKKNNKEATAGIFGIPRKEVQFVLKKFNIKPLRNAEELIKECPQIIIVDASDLKGISKKIEPAKVIELIDHRKVNDAQVFTHAKKQIELVGSAATLIAEKFYTLNTLISKESAALLYSAIVSNTINFKAQVTTKRDKDMAQWLKTKFECSENYIHDLFVDKSKITSIKDACIGEFAEFTFNQIHIGIIQREMINVNESIMKNKEEITAIAMSLKKEKKLDHIFLTSIDIEQAYNTLLVFDKETQSLLENALHLKFNNNIAKTKEIFMRKEIVPLLKEIIEKRENNQKI